MEFLNQGATELGLSFDKETLEKFILFIDILQKWNRAYNLTAIRESEDIMVRHIFDSLSIHSYVSGKQIADIGSGAGFPGIPLALALPHLHFTLIDSNGKKVRFLTHVVAALDLKNVAVIQSRVEKLDPPSHCYDTLVVRAFSSVSNIISNTSHLLCPEGRILIMKGVFPQDELEKIKDPVKVYPLTVPGLNEQRHLVLYQKESLSG